MNIVLGKKTPAPRNRSIVLTEDDLKKYSNMPGISELSADVKTKSYLNKIYCAEACEALALMPQESVTLIFADPPYNKGKNFGNNIDRWSSKEYYSWNNAWIAQAARILSKNGSLYVCCDWKYSGMFQEIISKYCTVRNRITWKREKGRGAKSNWKNNMEDIWFATKSDAYTFNIDDVKIKKEIIAPYKVNGKPKDWVEQNGERFRMTYPSNIWTDFVVPFWSMKENTPHPTQKPEKLLERVIHASSKEKDTVLDPFMGSGTTAAAAHKTGRKYVGFELNEQYVMLSYKRLKILLNSAT